MERADAMNTDEARDHIGDGSERQPYRVRIPGFNINEDIGPSDVIKRLTSAAGIRPCGGCERRAACSTAGSFSPVDFQTRWDLGTRGTCPSRT
jgi:hypothetical protein